ncbi:F-box/kelch-repeat protein At3g23880-like [Papaver somniferum]|uniref:F-box/kelch-repeat protein At3g23880-like n=1 Tax=Papaver somniferum TaxID=3469 RepID=UPI000E7013DF|nr:F-box/kelch-repeat protein At3g23880-like [Papaver somniferum]
MSSIPDELYLDILLWVPAKSLLSSYDALSSRFSRNDMVVRNAIEYDYPFRSLGQDIVLLGCCHGLICMRVSDMLCVWNPCTKEYKVITDSPNEEIDEETAYAFGYDSTIDDYKLFKVIELPGTGSMFCLVDVYMLGSNSWRSIEDIPYCFHNEQKVGVLANGNFHWKEEIGAERVYGLKLRAFEYFILL